MNVFSLSKSKILVLYHYSPVLEQVAKNIKKGAEVFSDVHIDLLSLDEERASSELLLHYDAVIFGSPVHYGNISSSMLLFLEQSISLWKDRSLKGVPAAIFMTAGSGKNASKAMSVFRENLETFGMDLLREDFLGLKNSSSFIENYAAQKLGCLMAQKISYEKDKTLLKNYNLPSPAKPVGNYLPAQRSGNYIYINQVALHEGKIDHPGVIHRDISLEEAKEATRQTILNCLSILENELEGDLTKVKRVVEMTGFFLSDDTFTAHSALLNEASQVLFDFFGERGKHARGAIGASSLPLNSSVEIKIIFEVSDE